MGRSGALATQRLMSHASISAQTKRDPISRAPEEVATDTLRSFSKILNSAKSWSSKPRSRHDVDEGAGKLRRLILIEGIPSQLVCFFPAQRLVSVVLRMLQDSTLRPRIWKILLGVIDLPVTTFLEYVARGPCEVREKIRNDTFR